ncbi:MAG: MATE family efflux transporter, partial [Spirochaetales bacterium]|nr:MATE family efflux transporter [Spirochaetales bacterium]
MQKDFTVMSKKLLIIALPIMLQNLISSSLSFVDTLMIGQIGQEHIAAVGIANQVYFLISLFFFGISSGTSIFLSQYYGSGEYDKMRKTMAFAISICLIGSIFMAIFSFFFPEIIVHCFSTDPPVVKYGVEYMKIVAFSYIFSAISSTLSIGFRSISKAQLPLAITFISLSTNAIGNYLLIFGIGPFPELGVAGAAIATFFARLLEMALLIILTWRKGGAVFAFKTKQDFQFEKPFLLGYLKTSFPVLLNEVFWSLGMTLYKVAFARLGTEALATVNITESIANFFFIAMLGIGNASTILLGNTLGRGEREKAMRWATKLIYLSIGIGIFMGALEIALAPFFTSMFNVSVAVALTAIASL